MNFGFLNTNNNCYVNSVIQALRCLRSFINMLNQVRENAYELEEDVPIVRFNDMIQDNRLINHFTNLVFNTQGDQDYIMNLFYAEFIAQSNGQFRSGEQADVQEFFNFIIEYLKTSLLESGRQNLVTNMEQRISIFIGTKTTCLNGHINHNPTSYKNWCLSIPVPQNNGQQQPRISSLLGEYFQVSFVTLIQ
jgi:uncharacterized UBP type Zn finger protein